MAALTATTAARLGMHVIVANRTAGRADVLAEAVAGRSLAIDRIAEGIAQADLVVSCTGALGYLVSADVAGPARSLAGNSPQVMVDLALPRDIDPEVLGVHGVTLIDLEDLGALLSDGQYEEDVEGVRRIVGTEVQNYLSARVAEKVSPTVVALRALASEIVAEELELVRHQAPRPVSSRSR